MVSLSTSAMRKKHPGFLRLTCQLRQQRAEGIVRDLSLALNKGQQFCPCPGRRTSPKG